MKTCFYIQVTAILLGSTLIDPKIAFAQQADNGVNVSASYGVRYDSNLFRLPQGSDSNLILGQPSTAEAINISTLRLSYDKSYSLQQVKLDLALLDYKYQTYKAQNQLAFNYGVEWGWAITPALTGKFRAERNTAIGGFEDARTLSARNESVRSNESLDAFYELDPVWRVLASIQQTRTIFAQPRVGEDGSMLNSAEAGMRYQTAKGSTTTVRLRRGSGRVLTTFQLPKSQSDNDFDQTERIIDMRWHISQATVAEASLSQVQRIYARNSTQDFSGTNTAFSLIWSPTAKTRWTVRSSQDISPYQTIDSNIVRISRTSLAYDWQISTRTNLQLNVAQARRRSSSTQLAQTICNLCDHSRDVAARLSWSPTRNVSLETSLQNTERKSANANQVTSNMQVDTSLIFKF
jgi:exopolysaccharide biosynthesis operon protein EpsL